MENNNLQYEDNKKQQEFRESIMKYFFLLCALLSVIFILLISTFIFQGGFSLFKDVGIKEFLFSTKWNPTNVPAEFGILSMIMGSIIITFLACIMAVPVAIFTSSYLALDCPPRIYKILKPALNLMAGIPSIVYGFFALTFIVPIMRGVIGGTGMTMFTSAILLLIMILPTIISISENAIKSVPDSYYKGSVALGATHERSVLKVVLPAARSGIFAGIILGIGRAIGETMAVILVAGNQTRFSINPFKGIRTMTTNIVLEMGYAEGTHRTALIATAAVLFIFILIINISFYIFKKRGESR